MTGRFDESARAALAGAMRTALEAGHKALSPGHMLLALLEDGRCAGVVESAGGEVAGLRARVEAVLPPQGRAREAATLPYSAGARQALEAGRVEARGMGRESLDALDLLLGLYAAESERVPVFSAVGLGVDAVRAAVRRELGLSAPPPEYVEVDRSSSAPLYEQVAYAIKAAVAAGRLGPGEKLPTVRGLAESLDLAPGTVARAYRSLESDGVVETAGALGTRVAERRSGPEAGARTRLEEGLRAVLVAAYHAGLDADAVRDAATAILAELYRDSPHEP